MNKSGCERERFGVIAFVHRYAEKKANVHIYVFIILSVYSSFAVLLKINVAKRDHPPEMGHFDIAFRLRYVHPHVDTGASI